MKLMNIDLYPLKFEPIYKEKIWGGQKLEKVLRKNVGDIEKCGESWEISGVEGNISQVMSGLLKGVSLKDLLEKYKGSLIGKKVYKRFGNEFPLLLKFLDAADDLSIQVHPDDVLAKKRHNSFGKTEMWYVLDADPNVRLVYGFKDGVSQKDYEAVCGRKGLLDIVNEEEVVSGDCFFIPAGCVHSIGKGILLAEIQQTSDVTYRVYDFDRPGLDGKLRDLHVEESVEALKYQSDITEKKSAQDCSDEVIGLVRCPYFETNLLQIEKPLERKNKEKDSFVIYMCVDGMCSVSTQKYTEELQKGEVILIPHVLADVVLDSTAGKLLEVFIP